MRKLFLILMTLMVCSWNLMAQSRTYHGTVLDAANNEPLIGATIMPIGGGQGAAADIDGNFTITVPANVKKAQVSYVGYTSQTVDLHDKMVIKLSSSATSLEDVLVVAYGTTTKEALTGSVAVVGSKEIEDRPVTSVTAALEGNAPGVQVNNSVGFPGSAPTIRIRGFNSINGSNDPLYVVDGVPYEGSIADLNPADIESMSVLKDAASSALYGNRGANGVILITTKKAKGQGKVDITLQVRQGMYNRGLPFYDRLEANDFMQTMFTALVNGKMTKENATKENAIETYRREFFTMAQSNIYGKPAEELFDENGLWTGASPLAGYTDLDWWPAVSRSGYRQEYNLSAAAATEKFNVFASAGYLKENGYMLQTDFERFVGRINANFTPVKYFTTGVNMSASYTESQMSITSKSSENLISNPFLVMNMAPIFPYYSHDEETGEILYDETGQPIWNTASYVGNQNSNVAWDMRLDDKRQQAIVVDATMYGTAHLPYDFDLTVRGNIHRDKTTSLNYANNINGSAVAVNGRLINGTGSYFSHTFMQTLEWSHDYGLNHLDLILDHENYQSTTDVYSVQNINQLLPGMLSLSNFSENEGYSQSKASARTESYLGRVRYNYDQRYFGEASIRRDGSSSFQKDIRWGNFWSVGASWVINREKFMHNLTWIDYLKLRAAYGSVGNDASAGAYAYYNLYDIVKYGTANSLIPVQLASDNLKWEATRTFDIALEGNLFNRFNFSIGYFNKRNTDLIFTMGKPMSGGTTADSGYVPSVLTNIGTMQNIGWELAFGVDLIKTKDLYWNFNIDATFMKNKIVKLPNDQDQPSNRWFIGKSIYEQYTYNWIGIDNLTGQSMYEIDPNSPQFLYYKDGVAMQDEASFLQYVTNAANDNALYVIGEGADRKFYTTTPNYATMKLHGTSLPTVYGSFGTNLSWKGVNVGLLFTYSLGGKINDTNYQNLMGVGTEAKAVHKDALKSWVAAPEGATPHTAGEVTYTGQNGQEYKFNAIFANASDIDPDGIPQLNSNNTANNNFGSSRWLTSASYLTLKNVNISYDFPKRWTDAMLLQGLNLGFSVDNLFIVSKRKGMNAQYGWNGTQGNFYVPARVFSFQLNVKF